MPHFFIKTDNIENNIITICDEENYNHIAKSLRSKVGESLKLIDENKISYQAVIKEITSKTIVAEVKSSKKSDRFLDFKLNLAQSPLRNNDAQNILVEKATELGVDKIYPVYTDNCALSKDVINKKIIRWQKIMFEASKQCERADIPTCENLTTIENLVNSKKIDKIIAFCERNTTKTLHEFCLENPIKKDDNILVIIGPEGGFSPKEFEFFEKNNIPMLTLGKLILRAETATIVALGNIIYEYSTYCKN